jgi:hypothetical protein
MTKRHFVLVANVSTESPEAVEPVLERLFTKRCFNRLGEKEFRIEAELEGENAKELNRSLLSELRRAERRTRLRAEWKSDTGTERFFDYVLRKTRTL